VDLGDTAGGAHITISLCEQHELFIMLRVGPTPSDEVSTS